MNYIRHLNAAMERIAEDDRLNTAHVSLYLALFQLWNTYRFRNPISINRGEVMKISKVGSKGTYHKCIKELHHWKYFNYQPSHNPLKGSKIYMFKFETSIEQDDEQLSGQPLVPSLNKKKENKSDKTWDPPTVLEVKDFLKNNLEAEKFHNYYTANGWKLGGKVTIVDWKAAARNWLLKTKEAVVQNEDNLRTIEDKNYHEPL